MSKTENGSGSGTVRRSVGFICSKTVGVSLLPQLTPFRVILKAQLVPVRVFNEELVHPVERNRWRLDIQTRGTKLGANRICIAAPVPMVVGLPKRVRHVL